MDTKAARTELKKLEGQLEDTIPCDAKNIGWYIASIASAALAELDKADSERDAALAEVERVKKETERWLFIHDALPKWALDRLRLILDPNTLEVDNEQRPVAALDRVKELELLQAIERAAEALRTCWADGTFDTMWMSHMATLRSALDARKTDTSEVDHE